MKSNSDNFIKYNLIAGAITTAILGTLSHFFYDWSGENPIVALISPVNESTWEHMKLIFFPILLWSLFLPSDTCKSFPSLQPALLTGNFIGTLSIPVLFYTYSGILGKNYLFLDIAVFLIGITVSFYTGWRMRNSDRIHRLKILINILTGCLTLLFFLFTFLPPQIGLFAEP